MRYRSRQPGGAWKPWKERFPETRKRLSATRQRLSNKFTEKRGKFRSWRNSLKKPEFLKGKTRKNREREERERERQEQEREREQEQEQQEREQELKEKQERNNALKKEVSLRVIQKLSERKNPNPNVYTYLKEYAKKIKEKSSIKEQEAKNREEKNREAKEKKAQEIEKLKQEAANFRNSIKKPEIWIKSLPILKQFHEKFKNKTFDELWKYNLKDIKDLGIDPHVAMPILRAIKMHPDNPKYTQHNNFIKIDGNTENQSTPQNWIKSLPKLKKFHELFEYTEWDQLWKYTLTDIENLSRKGKLDIPKHAAIAILRAIEMHPRNPNHNQYSNTRKNRNNAYRNNHNMKNITENPPNWFKTLQTNNAFKYTTWDQMQRFTEKDLEILGIPENKINLLLEKIKKYIKETRNRKIDQQELEEIKRLKAEIEEMEEIEKLEQELKQQNR